MSHSHLEERIFPMKRYKQLLAAVLALVCIQPERLRRQQEQ